MASIIDPTIEENGNPQRAVDFAQDAINAGKAQTITQKTDDFVIPDKFKGKPLEEIVKSYVNLESKFGQTTNELGQARRSVDQLLQEKRTNDLQANGATRQEAARQQPTLDAAALLENPTEAIGNFLKERELPLLQQHEQRIAQQERLLAEQAFMARHSDFNEVTAEPAFREWVNATPWRVGLTRDAQAGNYQAAEALMQEYKAYRPLLNKSTASGQGLEAARRVGLERSASGTEAGAQSGKILSRQDSMALRISDPDKYESPAYQAVLLKAIAEGRYK